MNKKFVLPILALLLVITTACSLLNNKEQTQAKYNQQITETTKILESEPANEKAFNDRGLAHYNLGNFQQALKDFSKAIELKPDYSEAYYNRGRVHYSLGNGQKAIEDVNISEKLDSNQVK